MPDGNSFRACYIKALLVNEAFVCFFTFLNFIFTKKLYFHLAEKVKVKSLIRVDLWRQFVLRPGFKGKLMAPKNYEG